MKKVAIIQNQITEYRRPVFRALAERYDLTVFHSTANQKDPEVGFRDVYVPSFRAGPFYLQPGLPGKIKAGKYDVCIGMFDVRWLSNIVAVINLKCRKRIFWGHRYSRRWWVNQFRDWVIHRCDGVLLYGYEEIERMVERGIPESKIYVAPNTIHVSNHGRVMNVARTEFLFVGRAQERKRIDELLFAFSISLEKLPSACRISIVGEGIENEKLRELARVLRIEDRVIFHGAVFDEKALKRFFDRAIAYVSPGDVGLGILHAFAYGVPVVTSTKGHHGPEFQNIENWKNSIIYEKADELGELLIRLAKDSRLATDLGVAAYHHYAKKRSLEKMIDGFIESVEG